MKKLLFIPLSILVGSLAISYVSSFRTTKSVNADSPITYIEMSKDAFSDWTDDAGTIDTPEAKFWDAYSFNALDNFFRGETKESWQGFLTLKPWKQHTQYIYFQWGGANDKDDTVRLEFHYGDFVSSAVNNTFAENPMLLRYFKIPDEQFAQLNAEEGFDMYITLVDGRSSDYAFHNFGYLHVNQSEEEVGDAMRYYLNHIDLSDTSEWKVNNNKAIFNHYFNNSYLRDIFLKTASNVDEDFEDINSFLNHWYIDINYGNTTIDIRHPDALLSNRAVRDGSNMPFNKTGAKFFSGWWEESINQGYIASDYPTYRFVSRPFVLGGTGLVSIKMAGRSASLHVIDAETQEDLAWADLRTFMDSGEEIRQYTGFNTVTMVRHYINLERYLGKTIQLAIADVYENNWAASYFDELVTNYETYPSFGIDVLFQDNLEDKTFSYYFDQYISSTHIDNNPDGLKYKLGNDVITDFDETPMYDAYVFLRKYYNTLRSPNNEFDFEKVSIEDKLSVYDSYSLLSSDAKQIVNNSADLQFNQTFDENWHKKALNTSVKVGTSMTALIDDYLACDVTFNANGGSGTMGSSIVIVGDVVLPECAFTAPSGYEFIGWKINNTGDLLQPNETITVSEDVEIYAQWKELPTVTYTVSFNANGATGEMASIPDQHDSYLLPDHGFTAPSGKRFVGWKINNEGELLQPGDSVNLSSDIVLYAQWEDIAYLVTFKGNGAEGTMEAVVKKEGEKIILTNPSFVTPEGYKFIGWKINNEGELLPVGESLTVNDDIVLYAQWEKIVIYTVSFNANGGSGNMANVEIERGQQLELPACEFTAPEGKEFECWIIRNTEYAVGDKADIISDIEVFAKWKRIPVIEETYTISFNVNGGKGEMSNVTDVKGSYTLPSCEFIAPEGKEFVSWLVNNKEYQPGQSIDVNSDLVITAQWKDKEVVPVDPTSSEPVQPSSQPVEESSIPAQESSEIESQSNEPTSESSSQEPSVKKGCGGEIISSTILLSSISLLTSLVVVIKRSKEDKNK